MPCKNGSKTLHKSIDSVLAQDHEFFELLIVDDGSTDNSISIISDFATKDHRVKLIINVHHGQGVWHARNIGLRHANGRYICFLDCDDYLLPHSLSRRFECFQLHNCAVVHGSYLRMFDSNIFCYRSAKSKVSYSNMLYKNHIGNLVGMYDTKLLGVIPQENFKHEDYLMWCKLVRKTGLSYSCGRDPLAVYRVSSASLSGNKIKAFVWRWNVLRYGLHINLIHALWYQFWSQIYAIYDRVMERFVCIKEPEHFDAA